MCTVAILINVDPRVPVSRKEGRTGKITAVEIGMSSEARVEDKNTGAVTRGAVIFIAGKASLAVNDSWLVVIYSRLCYNAVYFGLLNDFDGFYLAVVSRGNYKPHQCYYFVLCCGLGSMV